MKTEIIAFPILVDDINQTLFFAITDASENLPPRAVGHVAFCTSGPIASIRQLFVAAAFRRQGVGSALILRCIREARSANCTVVNLCVAHSNIAVMPFYEKLGFFLVADAGDFWMAKRLLTDAQEQIANFGIAT